MIRLSRDPPYPAVILRIILFALYAASAWLMLRSVSNPRLGALAWGFTLGAIAAHTEAIARLMLHLGPYSIGLLEAISMLAWTLAVVACFIAIEKSNRAIAAILLVLAAFGAALDGHRTHLCRGDGAGLGAHRAHPLVHGRGGAAARRRRDRAGAGVSRSAAAHPARRAICRRCCRRSMRSRRSCSG